MAKARGSISRPGRETLFPFTKACALWVAEQPRTMLKVDEKQLGSAAAGCIMSAHLLDC
jgi:hypothetical protein